MAERRARCRRSPRASRGRAAATRQLWAEVRGRMTRPIVRAAGGVLWRDGDRRARGRPGAPTGVRRLVAAEGQGQAAGAPRWSPRCGRWRRRPGHRGRIGPLPHDGALPGLVRAPTRRQGGHLLVDARRPAAVHRHAEVDEMEWLPVPDAERAADRRSDRSVLAAFVRSPRDTRPLLLLRNGADGGRSAPGQRGAPAQDAQPVRPRPGGRPGAGARRAGGRRRCAAPTCRPAWRRSARTPSRPG